MVVVISSVAYAHMFWVCAVRGRMTSFDVKVQNSKRRFMSI